MATMAAGAGLVVAREAEVARVAAEMAAAEMVVTAEEMDTQVVALWAVVVVVEVWAAVVKWVVNSG